MSPGGTIFVPSPPKTETNLRPPPPPQSLNDLKGSQQSRDGSRSSDCGNRTDKSRSSSSGKPKVVSATAVPQGPSSRTRAKKKEKREPWSRTRMR